ncbi:MAG: hypothetical protein H7829_03425 [Magnetococcus sp. THC-1_WYH]
MDTTSLGRTLPSSTPHQSSLRFWRIGALAVLSVAVIYGWHWWQDQQSRLITPDQQITLSSLADKAARKRGMSHQRVYADLFKQLGVRRTDDITVSQYDQAMEYLIPMAR